MKKRKGVRPVSAMSVKLKNVHAIAIKKTLK